MTQDELTRYVHYCQMRAIEQEAEHKKLAAAAKARNDMITAAMDVTMRYQGFLVFSLFTGMLRDEPLESRRAHLDRLWEMVRR